MKARRRKMKVRNSQVVLGLCCWLAAMVGGPSHATAGPPTEQEEFVSLFTELLERSYTETIEAYTDEKISYVGERIDGSYADVNSKLFTDKGEEVPINYKVQLNNGEWRVYDVVVANISMVNNFRSQFTRVIANSSYEELIRRLKSKAEGTTQKN